MDPTFFSQVETHLTPERLGAYRQDDVDNASALARYLLNMALCESLYSPLQFAEISLRNAMHTSLTARAGTDTWYNTLKLPHWQSNQVTDAKDHLNRAGKPLSSGRVVAELTFGFWVGFFTKPHMTSGLAYNIAKTAFTHAPKSERNVDSLRPKWQKVRDLRNRVFHHERVLHWQDLQTQHDKMLQLIGWMNPELEQLARMLDRFTVVRQEGLTPWLEKLHHNWPANQ
ncbi:MULTISPECIES: hypothetical protein [unclassified Lentimonas]|uniref:hypothetical protein n=1 Tax=unclassified Lentimonas TaxID=2630993 RepID=UPI0013261A16|nr:MULTISPECIES: hypothetical protein [unclassified Lentimonas]CAA6679701.1 Unannotated [Lentimonas sp. CC4]CAA6683533.1 Unannotated [Lentimonas sp. CC6]CAA6690801.1 Unannotated [Lentimonas sp. CC19]CAA6693282.1 Unannotated [Lentimonas sp. CC10]CAA7071776.1 Unannotated [Lentimonas sp. CC11]